MKAPELTPELKADLKVIKMRGALDPKRFYKKSDREGLPKFFQVSDARPLTVIRLTRAVSITDTCVGNSSDTA